MNNRTIIHFCFIRAKIGNFSSQINLLLEKTFYGKDFTWQLSEKDIENGELVLAELTGESDWTKEAEVVNFIDEQADDIFWQYLHGFQIVNSSLSKGCEVCGCT